MKWWTSLDPAIQAAWIGVFGSLVGGLIGALIGAGSVRRANTKAAEHAVSQRRLDRTHEAAARLVTQWTDGTSGPDSRTVLMPETFLASNYTLRALARASSPHLAQELDRMSTEDNGTIKSQYTVDEIAGMNRMLADWMGDPDDFEKRAEPGESYRPSHDTPQS